MTGLAPGDTQRRLGKRRRTIAVALDYMVLLDDGFEAELRRSIDAHCRALDLDLLLIYGRAFEEPAGAVHNRIFELIHPGRVDGLVIVSTSLAGFCGAEGMARFAERYAGLPLCSIGIELPGVPSVLLDNRPGMTAVIEHVLTEHDCRRVAFLTGPLGNPEASLRFQVYCELLERHGIVYDPDLVANGHFMKTGGYSAMFEILERGVVVDAVVASNDTMALGAIEALRERGYHVPGDIPVTGFDDLLLSRLSNPALTTVGQPFLTMTQAALHVVLEQLAGRPVPECLALPGQVVVRRSCGCNPLTYGAGFGIFDNSATTPSAWLSEHSSEIRIALARRLSRMDEDGLREADQLLAALEQALWGNADAFYRALEGMLESAGAGNERYRALHDAVAQMRQEFSSVTTSWLEAMFCDAISLIATANTTAQLERRLKIDDDYLKLLHIGDRCSLALDLSSLERELGMSLPEAGFRTVFVSCFPSGIDWELEPLVCLIDGIAVKPAESRFAATYLAPPSIFPSQRRNSMLAFPLVFETQVLGVAVFEYVPEVTGYIMVRDQIATALRSVLLHQEVLSRTMLHQRSIQERQAAAERFQALSVLAGGVAHDLNNALGPLVALPDVLLQELLEFENTHGVTPALADDIISIKTAAMRASQTIKDLLTLGRQGRTARQALDLNRIVEVSVSDDSLRFLKEINSNVRVVVELSPDSLVVRASEAQLTRAVTNLVRNAVEAVPGGGNVIIRLSSTHLTTAISGRETIEPGDYAVLSVSDTGVGIADSQMERIFEPFFSTKRVGEHSGSGLGLAIVLGVVKEHEGYLDVRSTLGEGTVFDIYLPIVQDTPRRSDRVPVSCARNARILIVDDDPAQLRTGCRVLKRLGYLVDTLESGAHAYESFARAASSGQSEYDLVILDMMLNEGLDGLQLLERIRELFPRQSAIIVSGHAPTERVQNALESGLAWLPKPYTVQSLARAVTEALELQ